MTGMGLDAHELGELGSSLGGNSSGVCNDSRSHCVIMPKNGRLNNLCCANAKAGLEDGRINSSSAHDIRNVHHHDGKYKDDDR